MASLSSSHIQDCGKRDPQKPRTVVVNGERRAERYASGVTERFVNLVGSEVRCQLLPAGVPPSPDQVTRKRMELHRAKNPDGTIQGFVEYEKCPLRHGAHLRSPIAEDEFAEMPDDLKRPCTHDPETRRTVRRGSATHIEYLDPCPHIQWLQASRRAKHAARVASRSARNVSAIEIEQQKLEMARQQLDEQRKATEKLVSVVEAATAGKRKAPTE